MGLWVCLDDHHDLLHRIHGPYLGESSKRKNVSVFVYTSMDIECLVESHLLLLQKYYGRANSYQLIDNTHRLFLSSLLATNKTLFLVNSPLFHMAVDRHFIEWLYPIEELESSYGFRFHTFY